MNSNALFNKALSQMPLVAILRGVEPENVIAVGDALYKTGFRIIEVPLNSPDPLKSIEKLSNRFNDDVLVGAGTVTTVGQVGSVQDAGGQLVVSPNVDTAVIAATKQKEMVSLPGFRTPSEAFSALAAGADGLKFFPCEDSSPSVLKAMSVVFPSNTALFCVGGIGVDNMGPWLKAGAAGFGFSSSLFSVEYTNEQIVERATGLVRSFEKERSP